MIISKKIIVFFIAAIVAVLGFNAAIWFDGGLSTYFYEIGTYIVSPLVFNDPFISMLVSLLSAAVAHSIVALMIVFPILYFSKSNHSLFIIIYFLTIVGYVVYELSGYLEIAGSLYVFALVRIVFQSVWLLLWYLTDKYKSLKIVSEKQT